MRSAPCASRNSRASLRAVGRFAAATESSRSRISASAPDSRPRASLRSLSAGGKRKEGIGIRRLRSKLERERIAHRVEIEPVRLDQRRGVDDHVVDLAALLQPLVEILAVYAESRAEQFHEIDD